MAFHAAMESYYQPEFWNKDIESQRGAALQTFKTVTDEQLKNYRRLNGEPDIEVIQDYRERVTLGLNMLDYYIKTVSPEYDKEFIPVRVEVPFEVPIYGPSGEIIWCHCDDCWNRQVAYEAVDRSTWRGLPVTYGGRLDMLAKDEHNRLWIFDWKPQPVDSPVLTPSGQKKLGDLKIGDYVIGSDGKPTKVIGIYPKGLQEVYEVEFKDKTVVECSKDHAWYVHDNHAGGWSVKEAWQISQAPYYKKYAVPLPSGPVQYENNTRLPMHPYVLGALLGDGGFTSNVLKFSSQSGETVELLKKYATPDVIFKDQRHFGSNSWQIDGPWREQLKELNLWTCNSYNKFIPSKYLEASVEDRILLLQGLCDTDGNTSILRYTTISPLMAECFQELVWSLGGKTNINVSKERIHQNGITINKPQYAINYWLPSTIEPNQLERKRIGRKPRSKGLYRTINKVRATGKEKEMVCIRVEAEDHLYMTNNFILTHNTTSNLMSEGDETSTLDLDDQIATYVWALRVFYNLNVAGFVYVEIRKAFPDVPKPLTRLYKGRKYSTDKTFFTTFTVASEFLAANDTTAYADGLYNDYLQWLLREGPKFHQRHKITKNEYELEQIGLNVYYEALDMINNPRIYPTPGRFQCRNCAYRQPCLGQNQGEDYHYTLNTMFERKDKHYFEENERTTD